MLYCCQLNTLLGAGACTAGSAWAMTGLQLRASLVPCCTGAHHKELPDAAWCIWTPRECHSTIRLVEHSTKEWQYCWCIRTQAWVQRALHACVLTTHYCAHAC